MDFEGIMRFQGRIFVPQLDDLTQSIVYEAHSSRYSIHLSITKVYKDLRHHYW